jgi:hypothetical protein
VTGERQAVHYTLFDGGEESGEKAPDEAVDHEALVERLKSEFDAEEVG